VDGGGVVGLARRPAFAPTRIPGARFCWGLGRPRGRGAAGGSGSIEGSCSLVEVRARDLLCCGVVSQPTTLPRAPLLYVLYVI
jgi:hypothetical protein